MKSKRHALVVGGTGMLKGLTLHLLNSYDKISVIARNKSGFERLESEAGSYNIRLNRIQLDYTDYVVLKNLLIKSINDYSEISLAVSWVHSTAPKAPFIIADIINQTSLKCDFYEVLGSSYANPAKDGIDREKEFEKFNNLNYRKIILGFVLRNSKSRWLTNSEISGGVVDAIENKSPSAIIGVAEPWSARP
jgi:hypothetical protein